MCHSLDNDLFPIEYHIAGFTNAFAFAIIIFSAGKAIQSLSIGLLVMTQGVIIGINVLISQCDNEARTKQMGECRVVCITGVF